MKVYLLEEEQEGDHYFVWYDLIGVYATEDAAVQELKGRLYDIPAKVRRWLTIYQIREMEVQS